jgi:hypothetical protein
MVDSDLPRRLLLAVTGLTPQVATDWSIREMAEEFLELVELQQEGRNGAR